MGVVRENLDRVARRYRALPGPARVALVVLLVVLVYLLPLLRPPIITTNQIDFGGVMFAIAAFALVAVGLNVVIGYAGLLDLGYVGFYAVGAYTTGVLTSYHAHWAFFLALPVAIAVTMVTGVLLGWPTLRVRGDYLAIVTLGFGEIIRIAVTNVEWVGAARGIKDIPHPPNIGPDPEPPFGDGGLFTIPSLQWDGIVPSLDSGRETTFLVFGAVSAVPYYWLVLSFLILILFADRLIKDSRVGRAWEATREDEDAAEHMGVPTFKFKLLAFALGAAVGGLSGSLYASSQSGYINPQSFPLLLSILFVAAVIVGGAGNRWGAIIGGTLVAYLPERFREFADFRLLVFGLALMILPVYRSQGLLPPRRTIRARAAAEEIEHLEGRDEAPTEVV
ncbi:branched-chain amino acid ABC transporter permease [Phycicoccus endophyticus]|uniref:Branched-chain amino acid ABC transporter permease n=1 Tax=Phycicoccus endophyticus TaxID=1690220 RepID=A0A7G9R3D7_9MICO|nr:branched-chain amino acid ABC transporter permease [Phycicoccus endophyticus]NHI19866.1 branched-chain amino acid ABC transporter permease [Phycicoccus endophyticus]QNN50112.1 branched-chain amino acid ABC transporter permease [Phycicoccus endophyticus]GGL27926.1 high-affinity branched-chain amino acid ABC transporter (LivM) [Phycicoccus endophyticus]